MAVPSAATVELHRTTGIEVPAHVVEALGGRSLVPISAQVRAASGVAAGDELEVTLDLDTAPRTVEVPPDLSR